MKNIVNGIALILCAAFASPALAQDEIAGLIANKRCNACHEASASSLGPSWTAIAARHSASDKGLMTQVLARKIVHGGGGNWGNVPMVPNQRVSYEEAARMAAWILSGGPGN